MKIIVGTSVAKYYKWPGAFDCRMAYVVGLQKLGHEVYLFDDSIKECFDDSYQPTSFENWAGRRRFEGLTRWYEVWPRCCLIYRQGEATHGLTLKQVIEVAKDADLLININGKLTHPEIVSRIPCRAYVDEAPAHTQIYYAEYHIDQGLEQHHHFFSFGLNVGTERCEIPNCGVAWKPFPPPVLLDYWPESSNGQRRRFTTISNWAGEATFNFKGRFSGEKSDGWSRFIELPKHTTQELEIALNIDSGWVDDIKRFNDNGWILADPKRIASFDDYRNYIANSRAEFSVANSRYVQFRSGWFSDRSARYLASGRPVLVQSTGVEARLPVGKGLLTFETLDEAAEKIDEINSDYETHCRAARAIASEHFDAEKVLARMLRQIGG